MKRLFAFVTAALLVFLVACDSKDSWETVTIEACGEFRVPAEWEVVVEEEFLSFVSETGEVLLIEYYDGGELNPQFDNVEETIWKRDVNYSNSAGIGWYEIRYKDGTSAEAVFLKFRGDRMIELVCLDNAVPDKMLKKITKSFVLY